MRRSVKSEPNAEPLLKLRDAALELGISFPTIKQWIYKKKIRSIRTAGGHHRIPRSEVDKLLFRTRGGTEKERKQVVRRCSGRNQLVGRVDSYCNFGARDAVEGGSDGSRPHKGY
jgi:excisionase family DNA binding protein